MPCPTTSRPGMGTSGFAAVAISHPPLATRHSNRNVGYWIVVSDGVVGELRSPLLLHPPRSHRSRSPHRCLTELLRAVLEAYVRQSSPVDTLAHGVRDGHDEGAEGV